MYDWPRFSPVARICKRISDPGAKPCEIQSCYQLYRKDIRHCSACPFRTDPHFDVFEIIYSITFWFSIPLWLLMLFFPFLKLTHWIVKSNFYNLIFATLQTTLIISTFFITTDNTPGNTNIFTLEGFQKNLQNKYSALAFTSHYM